ncbi:hypothetical protein [Geodermatophilus sp. SYSU D00710]
MKVMGFSWMGTGQAVGCRAGAEPPPVLRWSAGQMPVLTLCVGEGARTGKIAGIAGRAVSDVAAGHPPGGQSAGGGHAGPGDGRGQFPGSLEAEHVRALIDNGQLAARPLT